MWRSDNTRRPVARVFEGRWAGLALPALILMMGWVTMWPGEGSAQQADALAPNLDASHALAVHQLVEQWTLAGAIPGVRAAPVRANRVLGVRVTLRSEGFTLGTGTAWRDDLPAILAGEAQAGPLDLVSLAERATHEAFRGVEDKLRKAARDAAMRDVLGDRLRGAGQVAELEEIGHELLPGVQIAGLPVAIELSPDDPRGALYARFAPGAHGLLAHDPEDPTRYGAVWPGTALAQNLPPTGQVRVALKPLDRSLDAVDAAARPGGFAVHRFGVQHAVRPRAGLNSVVLVRGNVMLPRHRFGREMLDTLSTRVTAHLLRRFLQGGTVRGTYNPTTGVYDPSEANLRDAAMACFALAAHLDTERQLGDFEPRGFEIEQRVGDLLQGLAFELDGDTPPALDPAASGLLTLARLRLSGNQADPISRRFAGELMLDRDPAGWIVDRTQADPDGENAEPKAVSPTVAAMAAYALGAHALASDDAGQAEAAAALVDELWKRIDHQPAANTAILPWLAWISFDLEPGWVGRGWLDAGAHAARRDALAQAVDLLQEQQVIEPPLLGPKDVTGGFELGGAPPGAPPNPNWTTAPLMCFTAVAMRDADRHADRFGRMITVQYAARFLGQLMLADAGTYYARGPENAVGGLRRSLYDNRLDVVPNSFALLALDAFRRTLWLEEQAQLTADSLPEASDSSTAP